MWIIVILIIGIVIFVIWAAAATRNGASRKEARRILYKADRTVRCDGLYQRQVEGYSSYFRFFPDGRVVDVSSTGTPVQVIRWLDHDYKNNGIYTIKNRKIKFTTTSPMGSVDYNGKILKEDVLKLNLRSHINGHTEKHVKYSFYRC